MAIIFLGFKIRSILWGLGFALIFMLIFVQALGYTYIVGWFAGINIATFLRMGKDKLASKSGMTRTPEAALLTMALAGGFPGLFAGRKLFNHKTTKTSFVTAMWLLFMGQLLAAAYFLGNITSLDDVLNVIGIEKQEEILPKSSTAPAAGNAAP